MRLIDPQEPRAVTEYDSTGASWTPVGEAAGQAHIGVMRLEPKGILGRHAASTDQYFLVLEGGGWVAGSDGERIELGAGQAAYWNKAEWHESGTETGMTVLIVESYGPSAQGDR